MEIKEHYWPPVKFNIHNNKTDKRVVSSGECQSAKKEMKNLKPVMQGKKGMYFTLMTIAFLVIFLFLFFIPSYQRLSEKTTVVELRVEAMDNVLKDVERDMERGLYISSFRGLLSMEEYVTEKGSFLDNSPKRFSEAVLNGTINGTNSTLMISSTFSNWVQKIQTETLKFNINTTITIHSVSISQEDPWHVVAKANVTIQMNDVTNVASWYRKEEVKTILPIFDFEDPVYIIYSYGRSANAIEISPYENNYTYLVNGTWNTTNVMKHIEHSYYVANTLAPSFLMRFENNLSNSSNGIESMVYVPELSDEGLIINSGSSIIDYYYWKQTLNGNYRINFTPSWVKFDQPHLARYNLTTLSYVGT